MSFAELLAGAEPRDLGFAVDIPEDWHQPILQKGGVVAASHDISLAREFMAFLQSPAGAAILTSHGLTPASRQ